MKNFVIIYWSGTGNTKKMAEAVTAGIADAGNNAVLKNVESASIEDVLSADGFALGCPSMGVEVLEEGAMEPFVSILEKQNIAGKPCVLFGSYDWGDGEWMRNWCDRMRNVGVNLIEDGLIVQGTPDESGLELCRELGKRISY